MQPGIALNSDWYERGRGLSESADGEGMKFGEYCRYLLDDPIVGYATLYTNTVDYSDKENIMPTLVINAPKLTTQQQNKKSFESTLASGVGDGYAISKKLFEQLYPGCGVVLLSKDQKLRAEGKLVKLIPTCKADNGIQRYDVQIDKLTRVPYKPESLNRNGVTVIE